ncbi:MAG: tRNA guanosine(34) transglycosylase Tgt [Planctomycetes bacterium]|nr:tRNA guanosine(34) transglycosylase Tgt [Planctomycetota bacterium]
MDFRVEARDGNARAGLAAVRGRTFRTPAFMPVGTAGSVKALAPCDLDRAGVEILLANTYHLRLRPGPERIRRLGGLHVFMGGDGAILTDSGGYQVFSQAGRVRIDEEGAAFRSHLDGEAILLTPEEVIRIQDALDPDIAMVLDHPVALPAAAEEVAAAAERTIRWAERSLAFHRSQVHSGQALFGIVQGAADLEIRARQVESLASMGFDGLALGGLAVGESKDEIAATMRQILPRFPAASPRYVMGIGYPEDLLLAIENGGDMFDCVLPTRHARTGQAFTSRGVVRLRHAALRDSLDPLDAACDCNTCARFERGYLAHLYHCDEMLGPILVARHNVRFYQRLVRAAGDAVRNACFAAFRAGFLEACRQESRTNAGGEPTCG